MTETDDEYSEIDDDFVADENECREETCPDSMLSTHSSEMIQSQNDGNGRVPVATEECANMIHSFPNSVIHSQPYEATKKIVSERNVSMALEISKQKNEVKLLRREVESFRAVLLQGINGGVTDSRNYEHVSVEDLLRIRLQEAPDSTSMVWNNDAPTPQVLFRDESSMRVIQKLEHKLAMETKQKDELEAKCKSLKEELSAATKQREGVENLGLKISEMSLRLRNERELKSKLSKEFIGETRKVEALSDHIEKLMVHLKHEAISKSRSLAEQSRLQRELDMLKTRVEHMVKKNERKDKVISELRETGKLLEDQLRLMDEKYMELRSKLDWTRSQTSKIVKQKDMELTHLTEKLSLIVDTTPIHERNDDLLDDFKRVAMKPRRSIQKPKSIFFPDDRKVSKDRIAAIAIKSESGLL